MNSKQVQVLLETLLARERDHGDAPIKAVTTIGGSHLVVTFDDGTMARLDITISPAPEGARS